MTDLLFKNEKNLEFNIDVINKGELWWRNNGYPAVRDFMIVACTHFLDGQNVFTAEGKLSKKYKDDLDNLLVALNTSAPQNLWINVENKSFGSGVFHTRTLELNSNFMVRVRDTVGKYTNLDWDLRIEFNREDLDRLSALGSMDEWIPLTLESVKEAHKELEKVHSEIERLESEAKRLKSYLAGVSGKEYN